MSDKLTPVYDSLWKKYQTTRRRVFKDDDGKYKEKLEIKNCEKRTLYGTLPFEANPNWKLDDLSGCDGCNDDQKISQKQKRQNNAADEDYHNGAASSDKKDEKSNRITYVSEAFDSDFKGTLQTLIAKLKNEKQNNQGNEIQGVTKIYEKERLGESSYGCSNGSSDANFTY